MRRSRAGTASPRLAGAHALEPVDHITPVLFGGTDDLSNLQALCSACNLEKGAA